MTDEVLEGYVVDLICLRGWPHDETAHRARDHRRSCALHGACVESGYALVDASGSVHPLDPKATPRVVHALSTAVCEDQVWLRVLREAGRDGMRTTDVGLTPPPAS